MTDMSERIGQVLEVAGSQVRVLLAAGDGANGPDGALPLLRIGMLVKMRTGISTVFGVVDSVRAEPAGGGAAPLSHGFALIDLLGEAMNPEGDRNAPRFQRGVSIYPALGTPVETATSADIAQVYAKPSNYTVRIGTIYQDSNVPAYLMTDPMLGKHCAVLGTTGSGKSCTVALILRAILNSHPAGHVVLLDAHAEYAQAFGDLAEVVDISTLQLPCWMLDFEEAVAVFVRGGDPADREPQIQILKDALLLARRKFVGNDENAPAITVDTPVPFRLGDFNRAIDEAMGKLDKPDNSTPYLRLKHRIESLQGDRRFAFMFPGAMVRDNLNAILSRILRIPVSGKPLTIMDISGVPSEVVDVVVSVLCRAIFDFSLWGERARQQPTLLVCEEAHRYIPAVETAGFASTKQAMTRIAKEGRKYGVSLCLVTQRPSELHPSILTQCGTLFALRMNNEQDQNFVARALPENAHGLLSVLPELRVQEALVVGEGVTVPMRVRLDSLALEHQPRSETAVFSDSWQYDREGSDFVNETIERWRHQRRGR